ncbi:MAG TPA: hypothetical protein VKX17_16520 [Planctomycetota bacterium]|nr:hypothetical protein [Planctomycetota bacterium]
MKKHIGKQAREELNGAHAKVKSVEKQARELAAEHLEEDDEIEAVYWFPSKKEVRLIEVQENVPKNLDKAIHPFYFGPMPDDNHPWTTAIRIIRSDEFGKLKLPKSWGSWKSAVKLGAAG